MKKLLFFLFVSVTFCLNANAQYFSLPQGVRLNGIQYDYGSYYFLGTNYANAFVYYDGRTEPVYMTLPNTNDLTRSFNNNGITVKSIWPGCLYNVVWFISTSAGYYVCYPGNGIATLNTPIFAKIRKIDSLKAATSYKWY